LSNFVYSASGGTLTVAGSGSDARGTGQLSLAGGSNTITVGTIQIGVASGNGPGTSFIDSLNLGAGSNIINVGTLNIAAGKINNGKLQFLGSTGGLRLRGVGGTDTDRVTITLANRNNSGSGTVNGQVDFTGGHAVDVKANTITIGTSGGSNPSSLQHYVAGLSFDTGTVDATNINMAIGALANVAGTAGLTNAGGTLLVGAGGITLVNQTAGAAAGDLTITSGNATVMGNIRKASANGAASIEITGGSLNMAALTNTVGSPAAPIDSVTLANSTLTLPVLNGQPSAVVSTLTINGTSDTINVSIVPGVASFPAQFPVIQYASLSGVYDFTLGTLPGTYQGYLSNNTATLSVDLVLTNSAVKSDVWRGNVSGDWDTTTLNWSYAGGPATYAQGDFVTFDDTLTGTPNVVLATNMNPGAVAFSNATHNYVLSGAFKLSGLMGITKQGAGTATLQETGDDFLGGILVDSGTLILDTTNSAISGGLAINGGTVQIGSNDAGGVLPAGAVTVNGSLVFNRVDNVTVATAIGGTGTLTQNGSGTLTLTGLNTYTGNTFVNNGTLALSGAGTISNSATISASATLDVSGASGQTVLDNLNLNGGTVVVAVNASGAPSIACTGLAFGAGANHLNIASLPPVASYPVTFVAIQAAGPASGTFNLSLGTVPAATPPYAASVAQSADQTAVLLTLTSGPIGIRQSVAWTGADVPNLNTNWSDRLNWQLPGEPGPGENVQFTSIASQAGSALSTPGGGSAALIPGSFNNIVDGNVTIASLTYSNLSNSYHNTWLNSGESLTTTNGLSIGTLDTGPADKGSVTISGSAGAGLSTSNGNVQVWLGSGTAGGSQALLDLSALDNFTANVGRLLVGATIGNVVNRPSGIVYLAKTNVIEAGFQTTTSQSGTTTANAGIVVADCNQNAGSLSFVYLGQVNTISADTFAIGRQKAGGQLLFNPIYANIAPYPMLTLKGFSSSRISILDVANGVGNTGTTTFSADADLTGGLVNAMVDTINVGRASSGGTTASGVTTGTLQFDAGTINVNTLNIGLQPVSTSKYGIGTVNVSSNSTIGAAATLVVNGSLGLGLAVGGTGAASTSGTLNITNGNVLANAVLSGSGSLSAITVAGGQLIVTNTVGNASTPLGALSLVPLGTPDNSATLLSLPVGTNLSGITVTTLNIDGQPNTTNVIDVLSVGPVDGLPLELPLIKYGTLALLSGVNFNVGLGTMPAGYTGYLTNDTAGSLIGLVLTGALNPQPVISGVGLVSGNTLMISGTNGFANRTYHVLVATDVTLPPANWTVVATNVFSPEGKFAFTAPINPATPTQFYRVQTQ
jgi:autotransporter-associated beta strand protein